MVTKSRLCRWNVFLLDNPHTSKFYTFWSGPQSGIKYGFHYTTVICVLLQVPGSVQKERIYILGDYKWQRTSYGVLCDRLHNQQYGCVATDSQNVVQTSLVSDTEAVSTQQRKTLNTWWPKVICQLVGRQGEFVFQMFCTKFWRDSFWNLEVLHVNVIVQVTIQFNLSLIHI